MHKRYFYGKTMEIPWRYLLFILEINRNEHISYYSRKEVDYMVTVNMTATGANIKNMMRARNIKVKDVQAECGFGTPQAIFKWMRGDCMPTIGNMLIIADMFGCTMDDIVVVNK